MSGNRPTGRRANGPTGQPANGLTGYWMLDTGYWMLDISRRLSSEV
ncbi:hypothetical protein D3OALGB2SA_1891 [Olavius algarvensis associated proteobacterium Delta 3]|nr:hypothetical protein D3OALGB2SA_1891 [Olavius algarvensis associated proteobacterium Delta 3]